MASGRLRKKIPHNKKPLKKPTRKKPIVKAEKSKINLNRISLTELISRFQIDKKHAEILVKNRPYKQLSSFLKNEKVITKISIQDLEKIIPNSDWKTVELVPSSKKETIEHKSGIRYGVQNYRNGVQRVFISDSLNIELISADIDKKGRQIDYSSLRILSYLPHELLALDEESKGLINHIIHESSAVWGGLLWKDFLDPKLDQIAINSIRKLSQNFLMLQECTSPLTAQQIQEGCVTNGCTGVPDFDIKDCCDKHDICYWIGGTEADRIRCDNEFYECIKAKGGILHAILAWIYYMGVRTLGASHFNYQTDVSDPITAIPIGGNSVTRTEGKKCRITVKLIEVKYNGSDIGNDWEYEVAVAGTPTKFAERKINHPQSDFPNRIVYDQIRGNCGNIIILDFSVNATEVDIFDNDRGNLSNKAKFQCDGRIYSHSVTVSVSEGSTTAQMKFKFEIKTKCE